MTNTTSTPAKIEQRAPRTSGFTLVEILVAVSIMALLLTVILVPLRLGFNSFHIGKARAEVQQQAQVTLQQMNTDFRRAKFIFPNSVIPGISTDIDPTNPDRTDPCSSAKYKTTGGWNSKPYVISNSNSDIGDGVAPAWSGSGTAWENLSRIDMLMVRNKDASGLDPSVGEDYVVTYYTRRADMTRPYDVVDNPVLLYRAQYPFRYYDNVPTAKGLKDFTVAGPALNAQTDWTSYPNTPGPVVNNRNFRWIAHNYLGEANLEPLCIDSTTGIPVAGAHTPVIPRDMGLVTPRGTLVQPGALVPEMSFVEDSSNGRAIDRVTVNMTLALYDQAGAGQSNGQAAAQRVRVSQTFDLPNASCGTN